MNRNVGLLWIMACAVALVIAPAAMAQDMTAGMVTDPPAPVADGVATFTATYQNLGPGSADNVNYDVLVPILPQTWPPESDGFNAMLESTVGTDTNGNDVFWGFDSPSMCNYYLLELQQPNVTGDQPMLPNPFPGGASGSFSFGLPVIPMEGVNAGRVVITEPESLRNSYGVNSAQWDTYTWVWENAGLYNLVSTGALCDSPDAADNCTVCDCSDQLACIGDRLWSVEPFEADVELVQGADLDPLYGCGGLVDFTAGNIAMMRRGGSYPGNVGCTFVEKIENAQDAGAVAVIMVNSPSGSAGDICLGSTTANPDECILTMGGEPGSGYFIDIPAVMMGRRQGEELIAALEGGQTVRAQMGAIPGGHVDVFSWIFSDVDPDLTNDYLVTRVPLGEMGPTSYLSFIPAAALAAGAEGAFFQTDLDINNKGTSAANVILLWLPRGADNSEPTASDPIVLSPGQSMQYENVLNAVFGAEPPVKGALAMVSDSVDVIAMSRTYNVGGLIGNFGQGLPGIPSDQLIGYGETRRIIFMSENDDIRANVGCVNGLDTALRVNIDMYDGAGTMLETRTMDLGPWSNRQFDRIFRDYAPVNGYVDVSTPTEGGAFYCYGSVLDNKTSDPTTVLPQVPSADFTFIPAAALAAGREGAFFQTDVDVNNAGTTAAEYSFVWLPRGQDNSNLEPLTSASFTLAPGASARYENVLSAVFGAVPNQLGALAVAADSASLLTLSRTYNLLGDGNPLGFPAGSTFGQELPGIPADMMIPSGEKKRIIFMNQNEDVRTNVGCQNGVNASVSVTLELFDASGNPLETKTMALPPWSNEQENAIFEDYAPVQGYVDISTSTPDATIYCYGSVLDNINSDPTTVLPQ